MGKQFALGRFEDPCRNFSPIGYEERLQTFHLNPSNVCLNQYFERTAVRTASGFVNGVNRDFTPSLPTDEAS